MTELTGKTPNIAEENIAMLKEIFPDVFEEGKVDFDKLKQVLGDYVDDSAERYNFSWNGKGRALRLAQSPSTGTLRPCPEESKDWDTTQNLYIEGDNLEVLKLLQKSYHSKVKMIYIDPPYNTGGDFVYPDDYSDSMDNYLRITGQKGEDGTKISTNTEASGRYHTDWLNMMYPRLRLARNLLTDDGVIFVSIDDNEVENLKKICNEVFGEHNFIAEFIIVSNSAKNNSKHVSVIHEYLMCYAKNKELVPVGWQVSKSNAEEFTKKTESLLKSGFSSEEIHAELLSLVKYPKFYEFDHYTYVDDIGPFRASDLTAPSSKNYYNVIHPKTGNPCKTGTRGWAFSEVTMKQLLKEDRIFFGADESVMPQLKNYLFENDKSLPKSSLFFDSQSSTKWMKSNDFGFDFPKATSYIQYVISMYPENDFTVLDFFSGSATTGHANMQLNAEDGGKRKFIMVQLPEPCDENSDAFKAGYKNICEIGKERVRRAGEKIKAEIAYPQAEKNSSVRIAYGVTGTRAINEEFSIKNAEVADQTFMNLETGKIDFEQLAVNDEKNKYRFNPDSLDIGFKVFKLDTSNVKKWNAEVAFEMTEEKQLQFSAEKLEEILQNSVSNFVAGRTETDVVYEIMIKMGLDLTYPVEETEVDGEKVYSVGLGALMICLADNITTAVADGMVKLYQEEKPETWKVVFKDNGFADDSTKTNVREILKCAGLDEDAFTTL